jgi:undecaprenyl-diphosphatase
VEINVFRLVNQLPAAFAPPLVGVMQLGALAAVPVFALIALLGHRPRLARLLFLGGGLAWGLAKALQVLIGQEPPEVVLGKVTLHGAVAPGFSFPSTHVAVVAALAAVAGPYLSRPHRRLAPPSGGRSVR